MRFSLELFCFSALMVSCSPTTRFVATSDYLVSPKKSSEEVEVFQTQPDRKYVEVGMLEGLEDVLSFSKDVLPAMREEAARRGCDAIIVTGSADQLTGTARTGYRSVCILWADGETAVEATESAAPSQPAGEVEEGKPVPTVPDGPDGAAGFSFKASETEAEAACTAAGFNWSKQNAGVFLCSGQPAKTGIGEDVKLHFAHGKLAAIVLQSKPNGPWMQRFTEIRDPLVGKYGEVTTTSQIPEDCVDALRSCVEAGRARVSARWAWQNGRAIRLSIEKRQASSETAIRLVYSVDIAASEASIKVDAL